MSFTKYSNPLLLLFVVIIIIINIIMGFLCQKCSLLTLRMCRIIESITIVSYRQGNSNPREKMCLWGIEVLLRLLQKYVIPWVGIALSIQTVIDYLSCPLPVMVNKPLFKHLFMFDS